MKLRLDLDSSVLGAEFDTESAERVQVTSRLFESLVRREHVACVSAVTFEEVAQAPQRIRLRIEALLSSFETAVILESAESEKLANAYIRGGALPTSSVNDARHLAVASVHHVDAVVSWNFKHMVNIYRRRAVHAVNLRFGRPLIEIVSPEELVGDDAHQPLFTVEEAGQ